MSDCEDLQKLKAKLELDFDTNSASEYVEEFKRKLAFELFTCYGVNDHVFDHHCFELLSTQKDLHALEVIHFTNCKVISKVHSILWQ